MISVAAFLKLVLITYFKFYVNNSFLLSEWHPERIQCFFSRANIIFFCLCVSKDQNDLCFLQTEHNNYAIIYLITIIEVTSFAQWSVVFLLISTLSKLVWEGIMSNSNMIIMPLFLPKADNTKKAINHKLHDVNKTGWNYFWGLSMER